MRICMISGIAGTGGGLENTVRELSKFLVNKEIQVTTFTSATRATIRTHKNSLEHDITPFNFLPPKLRFAGYEKYSYSLEVWKRINRSLPFDVIHGHGENCFFPSLLRSPKCPLVMNIHGVKKAYYARVFGANSQRVKNPRFFPLFFTEEFAAKRSTITVACSRAEREELISFYGVDPQKIKVIYNGVNLEKFAPTDKRAAKTMLSLPHHEKYALWVGNNPFLKGLDMAIKAVKKVPNLHLLVAGVSGENSSKVTFFGMISQPERLRALYNAADFLIFPTLYEGFPLVPLEALACGIPILISNECPTKEIIKEGIHGFIAPERSQQCYSEKIIRLLKDLDDNTETRQACRKLAEKYSWANAGESYLKLYRQLTNENN